MSTDVNGKAHRLSDFRRKYAPVNLSASYCPSCCMELKALQKLNEQYSEREVSIIYPMVDPAPLSTLKKIKERYGITYPVGLPVSVYSTSSVFSAQYLQPI